MAFRDRVVVQPLVVAEAEITATGTVGDIHVVRSNNKEYEQLAIAAFRQSRFQPATIKGRPVAVVMVFTFTSEVR